MNRNFNDWISKFKTSISDYTYYVDFEKIYKNVDKVKVELNILNSLIGSKNIEEEFQNILIKYPETLECIPLLLAVRSREIFVKDQINEYLFKFDKMVYSIKDYIISTLRMCTYKDYHTFPIPIIPYFGCYF